MTDLLSQSDINAYNEIYRRYWKKLLLIAWNHSQDNGISKDIVQEVFIALWERRKDIQINNLAAFMVTSVKFQVFRHYQKEHRRVRLALENYEYDEVVLDEQKLDARFLQDFINGVVEEMPEKCKLIFRYSRGEGLKNNEIANKINISEKGVENTLTRALKILRGELKNHGISIFFIICALLRNYK
ncbi:sigma-70 family RNA polymerase sigma factor [Mucilaginibacter psychrotolerans]|uniref:sigma-70 family RNA polymerase sigma factor n=1 Tax=Mucilaginibacter psychrotolerans TaxID=1524096 RepID=UPI001F00864B|nr:sigma-70 family RNA polymerase sigma factor [Mucilaginibacter psychrotolerans]